MNLNHRILAYGILDSGTLEPSSESALEGANRFQSEMGHLDQVKISTIQTQIEEINFSWPLIKETLPSFLRLVCSQQNNAKIMKIHVQKFLSQIWDINFVMRTVLIFVLLFQIFVFFADICEPGVK